MERLSSPIAASLLLYGKAALGEGASLFDIPPWMAAATPRLATLAHQMIAEVSAKRGDHAQALDHIAEAAGLALTDLEWIDKCPFFGPMRDQPRFHAARQRVVARCEEIWLAA
jgi:serine/threonine-protein kinase